MSELQEKEGAPTSLPPWSGYGTRVRMTGIWFCGLALTILGLLVFRHFVFGDKVLLFTDVGADSVNDSYPCFVHLSDYLRQTGFPSWSFSVGLGQSLSYLAGDLVWDPVVWLPKSLIAGALVYQHLLKLLLGGLIFFRFLQLRGAALPAALLGALALAFSAYMCMGSCWFGNADELVGFAFLLLGAEQAVRSGRWLGLSLAVALIGLITVFHLYLAAILLCCYVPIRLVKLYDGAVATLGSVCLKLAGFACLGIGLGAIFSFNGADSILHSARGSGKVPNYMPVPRFLFESASNYLTMILRMFSNDMVGTGNAFRGWGNYFEAPLGYAGLFALLILPQFFVGATRRQRVAAGLLLLLLATPNSFAWCRSLFWLFEGGYYRTLSLFTVFAILTLSMSAFSRYAERGRLNLWVLGSSVLLLTGILFLPGDLARSLIEPGLRITAALLLVTYAGLLGAGYLLKRPRTAAWCILLLSAAEFVYFDSLTVDRPAVSRNEMTKIVAYGDPGAEEMLSKLEGNETGFYRISKTWGSGPTESRSLNDSMVYDYYGTSSYSSFNSLNYINFLEETEAIPRANVALKAQWVPHLCGHPLLASFACEKYVMTLEPAKFQKVELYEFMERSGDAYVFRNKFFLPLGVVFDRYLPEAIFAELPGWAKAEALMHVAVLSAAMAERARLPGLSLDDLKQQMLETPLAGFVSERRASAWEMQSFSQTRLEGTVRSPRNAILVMQTPFDAGWKASIDSQPASALMVDGGLLGLPLPAGDHRVEWRFKPRFLDASIATSVVSAFLLLLLQWQIPVIRLPSRGIKGDKQPNESLRRERNSVRLDPGSA